MQVYGINRSGRKSQVMPLETRFQAKPRKIYNAMLLHKMLQNTLNTLS